MSPCRALPYPLIRLTCPFDEGHVKIFTPFVYDFYVFLLLSALPFLRPFLSLVTGTPAPRLALLLPLLPAEPRD